MKTCTSCEAEMAVEATTCPQCGADQRSWPSRHKKLLAAAVLLCLGLSGAGGLYLHATGYDNCGEITFTDRLTLAPPDPRNPPRWQAAEACLWQHYRQGKRVMLTVVAVGEVSTSTTLFTVDPADQVAPIHGEMTLHMITNLFRNSYTCRAMRSTAISLEMEGCSGNSRSYMITTLYRDNDGRYQ